MSHDHTNPCSCCCSHYPDLLQKICPTRTWEVDSSPSKRHFDASTTKSQPHKRCCKCATANIKVKGKFGVAWICETPDCSCCEPLGWQVEFTDTPSKVEQRCREMIEWVNNPPLPKDEPEVDGGVKEEKTDDCKCNNNKKSNSPRRKLRRLKRSGCECCTPPETENLCCCNHETAEEVSDDGCCCCNSDEIPEKDKPDANDQSNQRINYNSRSENLQLNSSSRMRQETLGGGGGGAAAAARESSTTFNPNADSSPYPTQGSHHNRTAKGAQGTNNQTINCCNENCLPQVEGQDEEVIEHYKTSSKTKNRKYEITQNENNSNNGCDCERNSVTFAKQPELMRCKKTIEYRCCDDPQCVIPGTMRKRRIWLPAQVTRVLLRNIRAYLNSAFYGQTCRCNESVDVVCANKLVC